MDRTFTGFEHCSPICNILEDKIIPAQLAVGNTSKYPEFAGNVAVVETRQYHRDMIASAGKACYHWNKVSRNQRTQPRQRQPTVGSRRRLRCRRTASP